MISLKMITSQEEVTTTHNALSDTIEAIEAFGTQDGWPGDLIFKVTLAIDELLQNVLDYAYQGEPAHAEVALTSTADAVSVEIRDSGRPFDPLNEAPEPDLHSEVEDRRVGGLGVHFTRTLMDQISYTRESDRNVLKIVAVKPQ